MKRCSKSGIHEHSSNSQIHVQIFDQIAWLFALDFLDHGEDGFGTLECVWRNLEVRSHDASVSRLSSSTQELAPCAMVFLCRTIPQAQACRSLNLLLPLRNRETSRSTAHTVNMVQIKIVVLGWNVGCVVGVLSCCGITPQLSLHLTFGVVELV